MRLIQYAVWKKETNNAGGKAKNDVFDIMEELGFESSYSPSKYRLIRVIQQVFSMAKVRKADVLFVQYPAVEKRLLNLLFKCINNSMISIALVHDLRAIQGLMDDDGQQEIDELKHFDYLIVHNQKMEDYVRGYGYAGNIVQLGLFDYLHDEEKTITNPSYLRSIFVAGNLTKGKYLVDLGKINGCRFELFGVKGDMDFSSLTNVEYKGILSADEVVYKVTGDYGLIWDGDSLDECGGKFGQYLKYNNPHKLSLCMAAGKPVVVWSKSATAAFVKKEKIGICVDSLLELNDLDLLENYNEYRSNVLRIKHQVATGYYLKNAVDKILNDISKR